jgi:hypothetical protein
MAGLARGGRSRLAGEAFVGWDLRGCSHPLGHDHPFHELLLNPKVAG